jgi:uncharacterized protein (UPF0262 family)
MCPFSFFRTVVHENSFNPIHKKKVTKHIKEILMEQALFFNKKLGSGQIIIIIIISII